jgi:hypothetical protein
MNLMVKLIAFCFFIVISECFDENEDSNRFKKSYLCLRLENIIMHKICDESTINGVLDYNQQFLSEVEKCDQIINTKVRKIYEFLSINIYKKNSFAQLFSKEINLFFRF